MHNKLWFRPWDILARLAIALAGATAVWMKLPLAHTLPSLIVLAQLWLYLTLIIYPPRLDTILLCDRIEEKAKNTDGAAILLAVTPDEVGSYRVTVRAVEVWGTAVDKSLKVKFARDLAESRMRSMHNSFLTSFVPIVMVVFLTCILGMLQQSLVSAGHLGSSPVAFVIPFVQGLIGLIPFVWVMGHLLGEVTCHRDTVFKALS